MLELGAPVQDVLDAAKEAGRQLIQDGKMRAETLATVSRELIPRDVYLERANQIFQEDIDEAEKRRARAQARASRTRAAAAGA
jgi:hypothetical protein